MLHATRRTGPFRTLATLTLAVLAFFPCVAQAQVVEAKLFADDGAAAGSGDVFQMPGLEDGTGTVAFPECGVWKTSPVEPWYYRGDERRLGHHRELW